MKGLKAFTLIELLSVIAVITILMAILIPAVSGVRERAREAEDASRLRSLGQALSLYAMETNGSLESKYAPTRRWPNLIGPLMNWVDPDAPAAMQYAQAHLQEVIRPTAFDDLTEAMKAGDRPVSNLGVFGLNNFFAGRGAHTEWRLIHVEKPADTPLMSPVSRSWGTHVEPVGLAPEGEEIGYAGATYRGGPLPSDDGVMTYLMVDLSLQRRENFWPFNEDEPWRYFHPLRSAADSYTQPAP